MIIQTDVVGKSAVQQLCDIALKQGGVGNLNQVNMILESIVLLPPSKVEENPKPKSSEEKDESASPAVVAKKEKSKEEVPKETAKEEVPKEIAKVEVVKE